MPTKQVDPLAAVGVAVKSRRPKKSALSSPDVGGLWPWWVSQPANLTGNATPAWESHFPGDYWHGDRCGRFAHKVERPLFGWQWDSIRKILAVRPEDGLFTHPDVCLVIPRQEGKTQIIVFRILYGLFYLGEKILYTAQRWKTVEDVYDRIIEIIESRPSLARRLDTSKVPDGHTKAGNHGEIHLLNGASLDMGPRTQAVGRGQTEIDLAVLDEAYAIKDLVVGGIRGAQLASENPQTIYLSTAPVLDYHPDCHVFANQRRNGRRHEPDLYAAEWCAPQDLSRDDPEAWRLAGPSFGVTVRARDVARELRDARATARTLAIFEADYLGWGVWPADPDEIVRPIPMGEWEKLINLSPALVGDVCIAVARTQDRRWWAIAAGQRTVAGPVHVEVGYWEARNIGQVAATVLMLVERWDPPAVVVDSKDPAAPIAAVLKQQGIEMEVTHAGHYAVATQGIVDAVMAADITHAGQPLLNDVIEVAETRKLPRGDAVWDDLSHPAIAALKAITLVHWAVLNFAEERGPAAAPVSSGAPVDLDSPMHAAEERSVLDIGF
jgi:hypothetical protein